MWVNLGEFQLTSVLYLELINLINNNLKLPELRDAGFYVYAEVDKS